MDANIVSSCSKVKRESTNLCSQTKFSFETILLTHCIAEVEGEGYDRCLCCTHYVEVVHLHL